MYLTPRQEVIFLSHVTVLDSGCWEWNGTINQGNGYGKFKCSIGGENKQRGAHRVAYAHWVGPVNPGQPLDHDCHTQAIARGDCSGGDSCPHRRCVNPQHLVVVSSRENALLSPATNARINFDKTQCPEGHPYDEANTYRYRSGRRACRICRRKYGRAQSLRDRGMDGNAASGILEESWIPPGDRTHCPQGHAYDEANTYQPPSRPNMRMCRECMRIRARERSQRLKRTA